MGPTTLFHLCLNFALVVTLFWHAGCNRPQKSFAPVDRAELPHRALEALKAGVGYRDNPVVRAEAVEALESVDTDEVRPWIRSAFLDDHAGVRFAACMAAGRLRDASAESALRLRLTDADASVRVGAIFGMHRLGFTVYTGRLTGYLLSSPDVIVRRHAAFALGLLEEPNAVKVLAKAMKDPDQGVRQHALEAMARLGNKDAKQELVFMANSGVGSEEVFALSALAATGDPMFEDTFRYKLANGAHLETRLAAARGLGLLHNEEGLVVTLEGLAIRRAPRTDPNDPQSDQLLRIYQLAASAAGAIGSEASIPRLSELLEQNKDPRIQVAAARSILEIASASRSSVFQGSSAPPAGPR